MENHRPEFSVVFVHQVVSVLDAFKLSRSV